MSGYVIGGIIGAALLIVAVIIVLLIQRKGARRVVDRDELLRRATLAAGRINKENRRTRRGTMRGGGLGEGTGPNHAASSGSDSSGLP
jgi:hypothetical protein